VDLSRGSLAAGFLELDRNFFPVWSWPEVQINHVVSPLWLGDGIWGSDQSHLTQPELSRLADRREQIIGALKEAEAGAKVSEPGGTGLSRPLKQLKRGLLTIEQFTLATCRSTIPQCCSDRRRRRRK